MSDWAKQLLLDRVQGSLEHGEQVVRRLLSLIEPGGAAEDISLQAKQAEELARFLEAGAERLTQRLSKAEQPGAGSTRRGLLLSAQVAYEEALQFVEASILGPREGSVQAHTLEAADWLCSEGFGQLMPPESLERHLGPLVAIEARRSPGVWSPEDALPVPSLFHWKPSKIRRAGQGQARASQGLGPFSLICLPARMARYPESFPLLSHEVGHAVDAALGLSEKVREAIQSVQTRAYWDAWMPELLADWAGVCTSGEAFGLALCGALRWTESSQQPTPGKAYPPSRLRLRLVELMLAELGGSIPEEVRAHQTWKRPDEGSMEAKLEAVFPGEVLPQLLAVLPVDRELWTATEDWIRTTARQLGDDVALGAPPVGSGVGFRLLPSVLALAKFHQPGIDTNEQLARLQTSLESAPRWVRDPANWAFALEEVPALRATHVAPDGSLKVPPVQLFARADRLALVGATHGQLLGCLRAAFEVRAKASEGQDQAWEKIELFFASDGLLNQVVRDPDEKTGERPCLKRERDEARRDLVEFLSAGRAKSLTCYSFDGPPHFFSFMDWDRQGGRIHASAQLKGLDLRHCPSMDHVWLEAEPSRTYASYMTHLEELREAAKVLDPQG